MKIAIIDTLGLTYNGNTVRNRGLGGSESAVIFISEALSKIGFEVAVYCSCKDSETTPGLINSVNYIDHSDFVVETYDIVITSRSVMPLWAGNKYAELFNRAKHKVLWMHDTFCKGDEFIEPMVVQGFIDSIFTLSDFHTNYITNCDHGNKRNYETLKPYIFQTRNGAVKYIDYVDVKKKKPLQFVYNASATKGLIPLVKDIWPRVKNAIPEATLICIGGYYRFSDTSAPDEQEKTVTELRNSVTNVTFTGVISQKEIASILAESSFMLYPTAFPETFGISTLESLLYKTPVITSNFGALEETAIGKACYKITYSATPNSLFPNINTEEQIKKYVETVIQAVNNPYLLQQKQTYCEVLDDIYSWDTIALQWKQYFYSKLNKYLPVDEYRKVTRINDKVARVFNRTFNRITDYKDFSPERKIIIVSPTFNSSSYSNLCINSVAQQDYNNYIHVIINDASTDNTLEIIQDSINELPTNFQNKFIVINNDTNIGAVGNQLAAINNYANDDDIIILLDGDDWLVNNNTIFKYINDLHSQGYDFTYGSCHSLVDNIDLIAQSYSPDTIQSKQFDRELFAWKIPYTHLRTFRKNLVNRFDTNNLLRGGAYLRAGADNPLFYELMSVSVKPYAVKEVLSVYNDVNALNDYKINASIQNLNSSNSKYSVIIPTMWRCVDLFEKALKGYVDSSLIGEILIIDNDYEARPYLPVLFHKKIKLITQATNIGVNPAWNLGVALSKHNLLAIVNDDIIFDNKVFNKLFTVLNPKDGVFGIITGEEIFGHPQSTDYSISIKVWEGENTHGFGQAMFLHKYSWKKIIDGLKIYYGDNYLFDAQLREGKRNFIIYNINFESPMAATTSDKKITAGILEQETPIWEKWKNENNFNSNTN